VGARVGDEASTCPWPHWPCYGSNRSLWWATPVTCEPPWHFVGWYPSLLGAIMVTTSKAYGVITYQGEDVILACPLGSSQEPGGCTVVPCACAPGLPGRQPIWMHEDSTAVFSEAFWQAVVRRMKELR